MKGLWIVFTTVFLAELGDKTQLATLLFATDDKLDRVGVFIAASLALVLACLIGVIVGSQLPKLIDPGKLKVIAGIGFILVGVWTMYDGAVNGG
ncbi:TMEM165/GDT1 family protein [Nitrospina gracilis]|uniref:TMEM165/GDT1 family protein n=1 Tax=Nitrospina gracilis TaxID=35801 RepID=UPI001F2A1A41|nr:TMEM165/GDT1 family protein [Nitrospina gracilis]MCF8719535.1 putative Ca2+/H+ antiporter (TMEM165/GDT1 family) [Nitrospina gracilis Nb-211]